MTKVRIITYGKIDTTGVVFWELRHCNTRLVTTWDREVRKPHKTTRLAQYAARRAAKSLGWEVVE